MEIKDGRPDKKKDAVPKSAWQELGGWIVYIILIIGLTYLIITFVGQRTQVDGHSMEPSLSHGDNLIVDKLSYRFRDPSRYDVIVFPYQHAENTYYIKRIIGMPGETIQIKDGYVYINGEKLDEHFGAEVMQETSNNIAANPVELADDEYFVLGDNRNHSSDSRDPSVGILKRSQIIGRAWVRIFPFNKIGFVKHE
ncbi:signal peptidase I [Bariatricus massiliensis]|uniref:Signal peptidase I n=2 Tax=Bariatricus massiliensis TaxID=1745713 RepID=A0ABS8DCF1_9FIRM|nr:signal peptidase I [Bariatricus massiliensis]MCB7303294.1 signal peptidase I [Bariatricus massiliensis]MCB7373426.1 signal peptidase I [Bariatricus massiliensis]MCB7386096.1 signal peptidase I [Bariatricus massiliensis]MCB7410258.1 signal peptidase I [Bariatricus massiliensis]MCQ5252458.1 signal peptidase I [Bariatricus massiliensis]